MDTNPPHYLEHRKRLREKFLKAGAEGLHQYELLELLLTQALPRRDVKPLAKALIARFGGLRGVLDADRADLESVAGMGRASSLLVLLSKAVCRAYLAEAATGRDLLASPQAVVDFSRAMLAGLPHEAFMAVFLNAKNEAIGHQVLHEGTVDRAVVYPRRIVEAALARHAAGLILVHNHPSGHPEPSDDDKRLTARVCETTRHLDIRVLDHLIVGERGYFSFAEQRLMPG